MFFLRVFVILFVVVFANANSSVEFQNDHCVAWKTKKTMFLFKKLEPIGVSCDVKTTLKNIENGEALLQVEVPISSFDSGEPKRDKEVLKILKAKEQPNLLFVTKEAFQIYETKRSMKTTIKGVIVIGGQTYPVSFNVSKIVLEKTTSYSGSATLKFSDLKIPPPSVVGGAVAKVQDYLELHFQFSESSIEKNI